MSSSPVDNLSSSSSDQVKWKSINADWLWQQLRSLSSSSSPSEDATTAAVKHQVTVLDCRSATDFGQCHIRHAVHLSLPSIMLRRLAGGKVTIQSVLKCNEARQQLAHAKYAKNTIVLCGDDSFTSNSASSTSSAESARSHPHQMMHVLHKSLVQDGCVVVCLEGKSSLFLPHEYLLPLLLLLMLIIINLLVSNDEVVAGLLGIGQVVIVVVVVEVVVVGIIKPKRKEGAKF